MRGATITSFSPKSLLNNFIVAEKQQMRKECRAPHGYGSLTVVMVMPEKLRLWVGFGPNPTHNPCGALTILDNEHFVLALSRSKVGYFRIQEISRITTILGSEHVV